MFENRNDRQWFEGIVVKDDFTAPALQPGGEEGLEMQEVYSLDGRIDMNNLYHVSEKL